MPVTASQNAVFRRFLDGAASEPSAPIAASAEARCSIVRSSRSPMLSVDLAGTEGVGMPRIITHRQRDARA